MKATAGPNLVITTTDQFSADYLLEHRAIWEGITPFLRAQKDEAWYKVILHGIPIKDFTEEYSLDLIKEEIQEYNRSLNLRAIGTPYWLTSIEKRATQRGGAVVVAFATEEEAKRAISNRLNIVGLSVRVERLHVVSPTT